MTFNQSHDSHSLVFTQRIGDIMKRKQKERRLEAAKLAQKEAMGDFSHLKNKKGEVIGKPLPQPTLPNLSVDDDDTSSMATRAPPSTYAPSTYTPDYYYQSEKSVDYPPMPAYNPYSTHPAPGAPFYNPSFGYEEQYTYPSSRPYDEDNKSTAHLAPSVSSMDRQPSPYYTQSVHGNNYDPVDVYQGRAAYTPAPMPQQQSHRRRTSPLAGQSQVPSSSNEGLAYDTHAGGSWGYDEKAAHRNY